MKNKKRIHSMYRWRNISLQIALWIGSSLFLQASPMCSGELMGELPNGFRYVIKENPFPGNRVCFRLVMSVGSQQEEKGEDGAAHFIEHLAFRNTAGFPDEGIVKKLESFGEKYGATINAYTGYDRTVYYYSIPSDTPDAVSLGIHIAREWLSHINIDEKTVLREKPIILEEIAMGESPDCFNRLRKGADARLHRLPIGSKEEVLALKPQVLQSFYRKYYQPQNASLIIVGNNIDADETQKRIQNSFGMLYGKPTERTLLKPLRYDSSESFEVCADSHTQEASVEWFYPLYSSRCLTTKELIEEEKKALVINMINRRMRLKNSTMRISKKWYLNATEHICFDLSTSSDSLLLSRFKEGMAIMWGIYQNGFSDSECKKELQNISERYKNYNFHRTSEQWCDYYTDVILTLSRQPFNVEEAEAIVKSIAGTLPEEWTRLGRQLLEVMNNEAFVGYRFSPQLHKRLEKSHFEAAFDFARLNPDTLSIDIQKEDHPTKLAINHFLKPFVKGKVDTMMYARDYSRLGISELVLSNGARLILKPMPDADSTVSVTLLFKGGLSLIPEAKYQQLESVAAYMSMGGIEGVDRDNYNEVLLKNSLSVINTMEPFWHGMMASGKSESIEQLASLIAQRCFLPEKCYADFEEIKNDLRSTESEIPQKSTSMNTSPERLLRNRIDEIGIPSLFHIKEMTSDDVERLNLDTIAAFYNEIYTCSTGLNCIVTGNFDKEKAKTVFGNILSRFKPRQMIVEPPKKGLDKELASEEKIADNEKSERLSFNYIHRGDFSGGLRQLLILKLMRDIVRNRVIREIRNKSGWAYSPYVDLHYRLRPTPAFYLDINGEVNVENAPAVKKTIDQIFKELQTHRLEKRELENIKQSFLLTRSSVLAPNAVAGWKEYLATCVKEEVSLEQANDYEIILNTITKQDIMMAFANWLYPNGKTFLYIGNLYEAKK